MGAGTELARTATVAEYLSADRRELFEFTAQGTEIVHELVLAIELGATADGIANTMHIHPMLSESINSTAGGVHRPS